MNPSTKKLRPPVKRPEDIKPHPEWPGYAGDSSGGVWSRRVAGHADRLHDSWFPLKPWEKSCGHLCVSLRREGKTHHILVHRFILELFIGPCPEGKEGCHGKAGPSVNALWNVRWDTKSENSIDRFRHGRLVKLTPDDVKSIREMRARGDQLQAIGERFGVSKNMVSLIALRKTWRHV